jgi:hypothetical protein
MKKELTYAAIGIFIIMLAGIELCNLFVLLFKGEFVKFLVHTGSLLLVTGLVLAWEYHQLPKRK